MWKRRTSNSTVNNQKTEREQEMSTAAVKAMFDQMAAISMMMGMSYGMYMYNPVTPIAYNLPNNNFK